MDVPLSHCGLAISNTLEFLLSPTRDAEAAKRFFSKTLAAPHTVPPRVITVYKNAA
jgi:IS6 family transposase